MKKKIVRREAITGLQAPDLHPLLQHIYSARGVKTKQDLEKGLEYLEPYVLLKNIHEAVACLVEALQLQQHIMVIGDFDADGATSTALAVRCLQKMGAYKVSYLVPNRFEYGYGLTPEIVTVAAKYEPQLLITVDNGISSLQGVDYANGLNIKVLITDHHLPGPVLPPAAAIVNPNLPHDLFPSKNLAGVGVIFYVMLALRAKLREINWFHQNSLEEPNMAQFLDLVALGTVADVVPLDKNNRILVHQGLDRIRAGKLCPGIEALLNISERQYKKVLASDLGFAIAPRLNAAGRLVDMRLGIECLLSSNQEQAFTLAMQLDSLNKERQQLEVEMKDQALEYLAKLNLQGNLPSGLSLFDASWHQGIIGILAARVKDLVNRPVFAFAVHNGSELKGSGRSIPGLHLKDCLERIATEHPGLILKFGGHAMAAGMSIQLDHLEEFSKQFASAVDRCFSEQDMQGIIHSDGELCFSAMTIDTASMLQAAGPWGQGFPEPVFDGHFKIITHRLLKEKHLKFVLACPKSHFTVDAIAFNIEKMKQALNGTETLHVAYRLDINEFKGTKAVQLLIDYFDVV